jgi:hypothetical protein
VTCDVFIGTAGGNFALRGTYNIPDNGVAAHLTAGLVDGPVRVLCDGQVFVSERSIYGTAGLNETMATEPR